MTTEYEQQLLETIERQERELIKCREWMDSVREIGDKVRSDCTKHQWSDNAMQDLRGMHGVDMVEYLHDSIREIGRQIVEVEIEKLRMRYGK